MPDENVDKWEQKGHLYLWYYVDNARNYPGWNLTADKDFSNRFVDLIQRMLDAKYNCQKSLEVTLPTDEILKIPNNQGGYAKCKSPKKFILKHQKDKISGDNFSFEESENKITISANSQNLELLKECFQNIRREIDYSIEIGNTSLWFW